MQVNNQQPQHPQQPQQKKVKKFKIHQPHIMLWFAIILIILPILYVGSTVMTAISEQGQPVEGSRFSEGDLDPKIEDSDIQALIEDMKGIENVEDVSGNLLSSTLRVQLDVADNLNENQVKDITKKAWEVVKKNLPVDTYFTNHDDVKMYDIEVDVYNFIVDDTPEHSQDKQVYIKAVKNAGAKKCHFDYMTKPKDAKLVKEIVRTTE